MTLGPFLFLAPLALIGLIALPLIWWLLRATPPAPNAADLPSLKLLEGIDPRDETPAKTPWWVLLIRTLAAAAAILGLALPVYAPGAEPPGETTGPVLVVIDDGWTSANRWSELRSAAGGAMDGAPRDTAAHILLTAPRSLHPDPAEALDRAGFEARIRSLKPQAWAVDREDALSRLKASGLSPGRILWLSDGLDPDMAASFAEALSSLAPLTIYAAPPKGPAVISGLSADAQGVELDLHRIDGAAETRHFVSALTLDGAALATAEAVFAAGETQTRARFALPPAALSRISRFRVIGAESAGTVWLWDSADRSRQVGLVSSDQTAQPLLSDMHYIHKALAPFSTITEGDLPTLIDSEPDAIIMTDIGQIDSSARQALEEWIEAGGALIRFAGPRMAAQRDDLVPAPLRRSTRAIGGALTWEDPQPLGPFPATSPFAGLSPPEGVTIRQQVLARPGPELGRRTWARLADGSPLVTADKRGEGMLILFHVTAGPDWSDLPYSGVFVDMLRRAIAAGKGEAVSAKDGLFTPTLSLDGFGRLAPPGAAAAPLDAAGFTETSPSETNPPGLYQGPSGSRALNIGAFGAPRPVVEWPLSARLLGDAEARSHRLGGSLLSLAAILLVLDILLSLILAGRLVSRRASSTLAALLVTGLMIGFPNTADAQTAKEKAAEAARQMRLAYIQTGDRKTDATTRAGLDGLSLTLFNRSSVEPAEPHRINPETDALDVYPILFLALPDNPEPFSPLAVARLNDYMRSGGAIFLDTRGGSGVGDTGSFDDLNIVLEGLDTPRLSPVPNNHVLTRSFYLLDGFPGRYSGRRLWIEVTGGANQEERRGDGVSRIFVGDADYLAAWAIDERRRPLFSVDGGDAQREMARRFGVNLVVYVLTGNYKEDQVHIPALLDRLGEDDRQDNDARGGIIP